MRSFLSLLLFVSISILNAQENNKFSKLDFEVCGDFFVNGTYNTESSQKVSDIFYNYNRKNQFGINLLYLKTQYKDSNFRFNLALQTGTYAMDNYSSEPALLQSILEGNIGFKLSPKSNTWLDIGVFPSHIGYESAVGYDCWNISRSLIAENSPYFETGLKLSHTSKNDKFTQTYVLVNGWQKINMVAGNSIPAFGMQLNYKPNSKWVLNYSNFLGSMRPDSAWTPRFYNDFYATYAINDKWSVLGYFDIGTDKNSQDENALWYGANASLRYQLNSKHTLCLRTEFINDSKQVLYTQFNQNWNVWGASLNWDVRLNSFALLRSEIKYMESNTTIFHPNQSLNLNALVALQVKI